MEFCWWVGRLDASKSGVSSGPGGRFKPWPDDEMALSLIVDRRVNQKHGYPKRSKVRVFEN